MKPTRKQLVLRHLLANEGRWVAGMELMNAEVGGTRAGGRIHELRAEGWNIERRPDPRSAVHQYRLVVEPKQLTLEDAA